MNPSPYLLMLVGLPGSGKTTFRKHLGATWFTASSDDWIDYTRPFEDQIAQATKLFWSDLKHHLSLNRPIIVDRTNLTPEARAQVLAIIPAHYTINVVVFTHNYGTIHPIPKHILDHMAKTYVRPTLDEGFNNVFTQEKINV